MNLSLTKEINKINWSINITNLTDEIYERPDTYNQEGRKIGLSLGLNINSQSMKQLLICLGIFLSLALSRFIPHPPNFTSLLALSFYVPAILGLRYLPILLISFALTDIVIGYHSELFYMGKCFLIGLTANFFLKFN